jgi:predicted transposase YbfD/YdcC
LIPRLTPSLLKGRIVTLDAMHTQRDLCAKVHRWGGAYVLIANDNQPTLTADIADLFTHRHPDTRRWIQAETGDKGHGRLEHRPITCSPDLNGCFAKQWHSIEHVFRRERTATILKTGEVRHQVIYGLSNLSLHEAPPSRLLQLIRAHWLIENRLHWRRDVTDGAKMRVRHELALFLTYLLASIRRCSVLWTGLAFGMWLGKFALLMPILSKLSTWCFRVTVLSLRMGKP